MFVDFVLDLLDGWVARCTAMGFWRYEGAKASHGYLHLLVLVKKVVEWLEGTVAY